MTSDLREDIADTWDILLQREELKKSEEEMATWNAGRIIEPIKDDKTDVRN